MFERTRVFCAVPKALRIGPVWLSPAAQQLYPLFLEMKKARPSRARGGASTRAAAG
ncbi:hypothetical protein [Sphaerotilus hippei]|uniref:hypothetical protein n=1 Tax=Sphaerotilus hippei TaxID=744406 RepID=UPI001475EB47|nr:hypothetical protein [Sphaerotilus hippei]